MSVRGWMGKREKPNLLFECGAGISAVDRTALLLPVCEERRDGKVSARGLFTYTSVYVCGGF